MQTVFEEMENQIMLVTPSGYERLWFIDEGDEGFTVSLEHSHTKITKEHAIALKKFLDRKLSENV